MAKLNKTEHTFVEVIEIKKEEESTVDLNDPLNFKHMCPYFVLSSEYTTYVSITLLKEYNNK